MDSLVLIDYIKYNQKGISAVILSQCSPVVCCTVGQTILKNLSQLCILYKSNYENTKGGRWMLLG